ncbi:glycoside hydrolase [Crucibulum laeve]|uniref:Glycoside hydrolase n=1 Tax=Crucibulum laeve TaxID=68775 RepID=A0A5C3MG20_9AGAR|nr:glycoside hydrolase [Crucibulum laeve]
MINWLLLPLALLSATADAYDASPTLRARQNANSSSGVGSISTTWYTGWHATDFPLTAVSWSKYTHLTYAFAVTTPDVNTLGLETSDEELLPQFVSKAHQNNVKASLSIGGWTGSRWFSLNVGSAKNRTAFVKTVTGIVNKYKLDGVDFDWEYPGLQGIGCNVVNQDDTSNFLSFLHELRNTTTGSDLIISAATYVTPYVDASGQPSADVSAFSQVLDYMAIMNYDIRSSPTTGAGSSSPLDDSCAPSGAQFGSATSAVKAWTTAGMPADKILLGVPAYGHSYTITSGAELLNGSDSILGAYPQYNPNRTRLGDKWDSDAGLDVCGALQGPGGTYTYWGLIQEGLLNADGSAKGGISYRFDNCSQTPFVYNPSTQTYISFDNAQSFTAKGNFIHAEGLKGFAMWEAGGDYQDTLVNSIRSAMTTGEASTTAKKTEPSQSAANSIHQRSSRDTSSYAILPALFVLLGLSQG